MKFIEIIGKALRILFSNLGNFILFVIFFWEIPAPQEKIEKNIEIHRLKNDK